ncbi:MAG: NAD(P)-binding protein, partial [Deltaproteobacteria bacterium]|nr:NAD(P)-binding protein [Deltaproteobacteria bacterium]
MKYCILGAGPSGLSFARMLKKLGIDSFIVLESENEPGGLCRSAHVDGFPLDIGGGHFLDLRNSKVLDFIFELMPETEWNLFQRITRIRIRGMEVDHPLEANLWQFDIDDQIDFLESIAKAGVVKKVPAPESFSAWIKWKLGDRIA